MPCYEFFGAKICIPSVEEIIRGVVKPLQDAISSAQSGLKSHINNIMKSLETLQQQATNTFLQQINAFQQGLMQTLNLIQSGQSALQSNIMAGFSQLQQQFLGGLNIVGQGLIQIGNQFLQGINTLGQGLVQAGNMIVNTILNLPQAFMTSIAQTIDPKKWIADLQKTFDEMFGKLKEVLTPHSPKEPETAAKQGEELLLWGNIAFAGLSVAQIIAEALSMGQIDFSLGSIYSIPIVQAYQNAIQSITETSLRASLLIPLEYYYLYQHTPKIPGASDLVRFVVRECFPLENLPRAPPEFEKYMKYQGYSELWARAYWEAHWQLPAPTHLYEAFYRGIISEEELEKFLIWHDYKPTPRPGISKSDVEIMKELVYRVPTRTEGRMMWDMGLLTDEDVDKIVQYEGIHPEWREKFKRFIKEFMIRDELRSIEREARRLYARGRITEDEYRVALRLARIPEEFYDIFFKLAEIEKKKYLQDTVEETRELSLSKLIGAWKYGLISEEGLREELRKRGFAEEDINIIIGLEKAEDAWRKADDYADELEDLYLGDRITIEQYEQGLRDLGFDEDEIKYRVSLAKVKKIPKRRYLTPTQVCKLFWMGLMSIEEAMNYLMNLGYTERDAQLLILYYKPKSLAEAESMGVE